jgi:nucleoside 2-deoxyribosyltransferase
MPNGLPDVGVPNEKIFYIAGPFFNPDQLALIADIEKTFDLAGVKYFSPRLCDENKKGPPDKAGAEKIYERNSRNLLFCTHILAVVDWKLPIGDQIYLLRQAPAEPEPFPVGQPLNIPDSGTVWEMGAAQMRNMLAGGFLKNFAGDPVSLLRSIDDSIKRYVTTDVYDQWAQFFIAFCCLYAAMRPMPIVIFTERPPTAALNLMLTQKTKGVVNSILVLKQFLNKGDLDWNVCKQWEGGNR